MVMSVFKVDAKEQAEVYNIYLRKAAEIYGVTRTRQIYEKAIETLKEADSRDMCIRFALFLDILFRLSIFISTPGLRRWRRSWVKLTELVRSILTRAKCAIQGSLLSSGRWEKICLELFCGFPFIISSGVERL